MRQSCILLTYREGVELLDLPVHRLQQGEVAGDATLSHSEKRGVVVQEEMELWILGLSTISREKRTFYYKFRGILNRQLSLQLAANACFS